MTLMQEFLNRSVGWDCILDEFANNKSTFPPHSISATKDGSSSSQIHGVDNLIDITVALPTDSSGAGSAYGLIFEGKLNPYMNSAGFGSVNL